MSEQVKRWIELGIVCVGFLAATIWSYADMHARVLVIEQRVEQETAGYRVIQQELGRRLERMEDKLDRVIEQLHNERRRLP